MQKSVFVPIGMVRSPLKTPRETWFCCEKGLRARVLSKIVIDKKYEKGLVGLEKFSHAFVVYHLHKIKKMEIETYPGPTAIEGLPTVGIFASRSQYRPNPIALRLVRVMKVRGKVITVDGLDAIDGSPVLDIKPYVAGFDRPDDFFQADWYDWQK